MNGFVVLLERLLHAANFALAHQRQPVFVNELDLIFERDDMVAAGAVDEIDHPVPRRVTFSASDETNPLWSPDGGAMAVRSASARAIPRDVASRVM